VQPPITIDGPNTPPTVESVAIDPLPLPDLPRIDPLVGHERVPVEEPELRAESLGVGILYQGVEDKLMVFEELLARFGFERDCCAFVGDDVVDLPVMRRCGLAVAVPAAPPLVKSHAHYVTQHAGGRGAVREVCEIIMHAQGTFDAQMEPYLR